MFFIRRSETKRKHILIETYALSDASEPRLALSSSLKTHFGFYEKCAARDTENLWKKGSVRGEREALPESGSEGSLATPGPFNATHLVCISLSLSGHGCCLVFESVNLS